MKDSPRSVLARFGPTRQARLAKAPTDREKGFIQAVETLWAEEGTYDERRVAYMDAMADLHDRYPDDHEVATFYAVATLSAARALGNQSGRLEVKAGTIALDVFNEQPRTPRGAHYAIHAFDDPIHAPLALESALAYAEIAPAVAHARHMPTHIFIQHGMWDLVSGHNQRAYDAARDLWKPGDSVGDAVHPLDGASTATCNEATMPELGCGSSVLKWWPARATTKAVPSTPSRCSGPDMSSRPKIGRPNQLPRTRGGTSFWPRASAVCVSADLAMAKQSEAELARRATGDDGEGTAGARIMHKEVAALIRAAEGRGDNAITLMDEALAIVDTQRFAQRRGESGEAAV